MFEHFAEFEINERVRQAHREAEQFRRQSAPREPRVRRSWWPRRGGSAVQVPSLQLPSAPRRIAPAE
ncbi:hypothetical protein Intca_1161 [Intrasporangium calvum DSM 43043]|uniref:Uncharacterized protein n=1 Tax=Intrasporangium calvum (strain ATCC 23552 / DSM 43043 / JCM 3097 / NBRC 12989 / NCIMB 10167 / NRRL B-3866 / 7 KIP) TaxID=710696 RepID=E6SES2_INTC7|nr:hypothetical protein Intca_1161 [Intrasporangium calvum DSM 43043]